MGKKSNIYHKNSITVEVLANGSNPLKWIP